MDAIRTCAWRRSRKITPNRHSFNFFNLDFWGRRRPGAAAHLRGLPDLEEVGQIKG